MARAITKEQHARQWTWIRRRILNGEQTPLAPRGILIALVLLGVTFVWGRYSGRLVYQWTGSATVALLVPETLVLALLWVLSRREPPIRFRPVAVLPAVTALPAKLLLVAIPLQIAMQWWQPEEPRPLGTVAPVAVFVLFVFAGPLLEELVFRGWLLGALNRYRPLRGAGALILSSVIFGAFHMLTGVYGPVGFISTAIAGLVYGALALGTGSIAPAVIAHALSNLTAVVATDADPQWAQFAFTATLLTAWWFLNRTRDRHRATVKAQVAPRDPQWAQVHSILTRFADAAGLTRTPELELSAAQKEPGQISYDPPTITVARYAIETLPVDRLDVVIAHQVGRLAQDQRLLRLLAWLSTTAGAAALVAGYLTLALVMLTAEPATIPLLITTVLALGYLAVRLIYCRHTQTAELNADRFVITQLGTRPFVDHLTALHYPRWLWQTCYGWQHPIARLIQLLSTRAPLPHRMTNWNISDVEFVTP